MKRLVWVTVVLVALLWAAVGWAAWSKQSGGSATTRGYQVPVGLVPTTSAGTTSVTINWTQVTLAGSRIGTLPGGGYLVRRYANGSSTPITPGAGCAGLITGVGGTLSCTETAVPDGDWQYAVTPAVGSWSGAESPKSAATQTDTTAPAVTLTSPLNGAATNIFAPTLSGAAGVASGDLATITVKIYNGTGVAGAIVQTLTASQAGGSWTVTAAALPQGTYTAQAQQTDTAGNIGTSSANTFVIDTTSPPLPTITSSPVNPSNSPTATFAFGDSEAGVSFQCRIDALPFNACSSPTTFSALAAGAHTFQLRAQDTAGNMTSSVSSNWTIDLTAPTVTLSTPANGSATNTQTPAITGAAGSAAGDSTTITVKIYNGSGTTGPLLQTLTPTRTGATWTATPATLAQGTYTAQATQTDTAGNTGTSTANTFTIDTTPPTVTLASCPVTGPNGNRVATPTGTASTATSDIQTITITIYNGSGTTGTTFQTLTTTATAGIWTATSNKLTHNNTYTIRAAQSDTAANTSVTTTCTFIA